MKYIITLPVAVNAENTNADEISEDAKTLTWNLAAGEINNIQFEAVSKLHYKMNIIDTVIIILIIVILALVVFIVINKSKKNSKKVITVKREIKPTVEKNDEKKENKKVENKKETSKEEKIEKQKDNTKKEKSKETKPKDETKTKE